MGAAQVRGDPAVVDIALLGADEQTLAGSIQRVTILDFGQVPLPDFREAPQPFLGLRFDNWMNSPNKAYWRDLRDFVRTKLQAIPVRVQLTNKSEFPLTDCELKVIARQGENPVPVQEGGNTPSMPGRTHDITRFMNSIQSPLDRTRMAVAEESGTYYADLWFKQILPGATIKADKLFSVIPAQAGSMSLECKLYARELPTPKIYIVTLEVEATVDPWDIDKLVDLDSSFDA
jgi:hypothetical protein